MFRRFTVAEVERLIPLLEPLLREAVAMKLEYCEAEDLLQAISQRVSMMGGTKVNRKEAVEFRGRRDVAGERLRSAVDQIRQSGGLVKDVDSGLVDFPTMYRGSEVYLCWRLGESDIEYWHGTDEGFCGRKLIDQEFRDEHRGNPES